MNVNKISLCIIVISAVYCEGQVSQYNDDAALTLSNGLWMFNALDNVKALYMEKCKRNGISTSFLERDPDSEEVQGCQIKLRDEEGLLDSYRRHQMQDTMKKICAKTPHFKECSIAEVEKLRPCLSAEERPYLDNYLDGERQLYDFLCYNDGEGFIHFLEDGGLYCIERMSNPLRDHIKKMTRTISSQVPDPANVMSGDNMFQGPHVKVMCTELLNLKEYVIDILLRCEKLDHANFVESLTDIMLRATPCKDQMPARAGGADGADGAGGAGGVTGVAGSLALLTVAVAGVLLL